MNYLHTQMSPIWLLLLSIAVLLGIVAGTMDEKWFVVLPMILGSVAFLFVALSFRSLTVEDSGDQLLVRFGPLPVFGTRIRYDSITSVESGRTTLLDGLGIHYVPGRGWTFNIWGADCVVVHLGKRQIRIGTNDVDGLLACLRVKIGEDRTANI